MSPMKFDSFVNFDRRERKANFDWNGPAEFYLIVVDRWVKFGITSNWEKRQFFYRKQFGDIPWRLVKKVEHPTRWQAEFLEQMVVWILKPWVTHGTNEWVEKLTVQEVWNCVKGTEKRIEERGWRHYESVHRHGDNRWAYYKDFAMYEFEGQSESSIQLRDDSEAEGSDSLTV